MKRGRQIIGLPVVALDSGRRIGEVGDILYSAEDKTIRGLLLKTKWLRSDEVVPFGDVISIGSDAVMVASSSVKQRLKDLPRMNSTQRAAEFRQQQLLTASGELVGIVQDIVIDEKNGTLVAVELSDGLLNDLLSGRTTLPLPDGFVLNGGNCVIPDLNQEG